MGTRMLSERISSKIYSTLIGRKTNDAKLPQYSGSEKNKYIAQLTTHEKCGNRTTAPGPDSRRTRTCDTRVYRYANAGTWIQR